jgi:hypothetical protein
VVGIAAVAEALIVPWSAVTTAMLVEEPELIAFFGAVYRSLYGPPWLKDLREFPECGRHQ